MKKLFLIITFYLISGIISLIFRNLSLQDTGMYQIGEIRGWNHNINLRVKSDPCCGTKTVKGYLGQTLMISCSYPVEFKTNTKSFYRLDTIAGTELIRTSGTQPHQDRFSISDDRRNKVFSVNITDVREDDVGVYSCVVINEETAVSYHSLFTVIQLREVTDDTPESPDGTLTKSESGSTIIINNIIIIIITTTVCVFLFLLLLGGFVLIYKLRHNKTQDSASISQRTETNNTTADYKNDFAQNQNIVLCPVYQNPNPNTNQSDSVYQSLQANTNQSDSVYQSLQANTNQSDSVYQSLQANTKQSDSVYQSLQANTNQSDSVYQSLQANTNQSDSVYQSLQANSK
ncbi:uncharacterized protein LOC131347148 isoform X2 [Hemibagrus wyckioides]|uniref:uncharacterized protein LOC131347148 isoform X2 n=1 Tax=Hemibagrus wyckioides TaxID=337641 RepID=UPI00266C8E75|nr:uncharacterized protein LOC131347148 isoform X2 [Hemibagrus wyckioides]